MAGLWTGSVINSTESATVFNQLYSLTAIEQVRKKNGVLYAVLGKAEVGATPLDGINFERRSKVSGKRVEADILGKLKTIGTVADGSAEYAAASLSNTQDYWGGMEFDLAHFKDVHPIMESEFDRFTGDELKTANYLDRVFRMLMLSLEKAWGSGSATAGGINDTKAPARTTLGGWQWPVSSGLSADGESAFATYGTIDRSDAGNADARGTVAPSTGDLTLLKIQTLRNQVITQGGLPNLGVAHTTPYTKIQSLVQNYTHTVFTEDWSRFGGDWVEFSNIRFILEQQCPSSVVGLLDPTSFCWYERDIPFTKRGLVYAETLVASYLLNWGAWSQFLCIRPSSNGKLTGITS